MDKVEKFLTKLSKKDRAVIRVCIMQLQKADTKGLDIKKLKGIENVFRIRKGNIRIVYTQDKSGIRILKIEFRDKDTYR